jgi:hypothetical protein
MDASVDAGRGETLPPPAHGVGVHSAAPTDLFVRNAVRNPQQRPGAHDYPVRERGGAGHLLDRCSMVIGRGGARTTGMVPRHSPEYFSDGPLVAPEIAKLNAHDPLISCL